MKSLQIALLPSARGTSLLGRDSTSWPSPGHWKSLEGEDIPDRAAWARGSWGQVLGTRRSVTEQSVSQMARAVRDLSESTNSSI